MDNERSLCSRGQGQNFDNRDDFQLQKKEKFSLKFQEYDLHHFFILSSELVAQRLQELGDQQWIIRRQAEPQPLDRSDSFAPFLTLQSLQRDRFFSFFAFHCTFANSRKKRKCSLNLVEL